MNVGVPRETKEGEHRVALTPDGAQELVSHGHRVLVERGAGEDSSIHDREFVAAGAELVGATDAWGAGLVVKVKEPQAAELAYLRIDSVLFTYLHLAAYPEVAQALLEAGVTALAYETVQTADGGLPLLAPMSEVAGRMAPQIGAHHLERDAGGRGVLLGGRPGSVRRGSSSSGQARWGGTRPGSPRAWKPRSSSSTRTSSACAGSTRSTGVAS